MANFKGYIYKFTSTIDPIKCYIGKTFHIGSRLNNHLTGRGNTSSFQEALNLYGITCFTFEILYVREAETIEELNTILNELERYSINKMKIAFKNRSQEVELYRKKRLKEHLSSLTEEDIRMRANKCKKPIIQYSIEGEFIREWESATDAASFYNINKVNITKCCLGKYKTSIGYIWKYKEE